MSLRKALLVGINDYPTAPLRGCLNDVAQMEALLQRYYGFPASEMRLLRNEQATSANIAAGLAWLAEGGSDPDAVRVFHYSGHGAFQADENGDEPDGKDECLVPYDYRTAGKMTDDFLKTLYDRFPRVGNLTLVMDCCHSGSVQKALDVTFRFLPVTPEEQERIDAAAERFARDQEDYIVAELRDAPPSEEALRRQVRGLMTRFQKKRFGDVRVREANILLAACRADQQSADAPLGGDYHGAFTYFLAEAIERANGQITYSVLVREVGDKLFAAGLLQKPQLEYRSGRDQRPAFRPFA